MPEFVRATLLTRSGASPVLVRVTVFVEVVFSRTGPKASSAGAPTTGLAPTVMPAPARSIDSGDRRPPAEASRRVSVTGPGAAGWNVTSTVHVASCATVLSKQVPPVTPNGVVPPATTDENSVAVATDPIVTEVVPMLVTVTVLVPVAPTSTPPKSAPAEASGPASLPATVKSVVSSGAPPTVRGAPAASRIANLLPLGPPVMGCRVTPSPR